MLHGPHAESGGTRRRRRGRAARALLGCAALACAWPSAARDAQAQACCTGTGTGEFGLVGPCRDGILAAQLSYDRAFGTYDPDGRLRGIDGASVDDVVLRLAGGIRFHDRRLQIHGSVPLRLQHRHFQGQRDTRVFPGDATLMFRWTAIMGGMRGLGASDGHGRLPFLDFFVGTRSPTGRAPEHARSPVLADATGLGSWEVMAGAKLSQFLTPKHAVSLSAAYGYSVARTVPGTQGPSDFWPGHAAEFRAAWLYVPSIFWSGGLFTNFRYTSTAHQDDQAIPRSSTRRLRVGAYFTHALALPTWETTVIVSSDVPADRVGKGIPFATTSVSWILQRNFQ